MGAAAAPILIGSAIGGLTNRKNPLQGALLGGALGGAGAAFMPTGGLSSMFGSVADDAAVSALTGSGASTGANTMFANAAGVNPGTVMGASQAAPAGIFSNFTAPIPQASNAVPRDIGFFESTFNPNIQSSSMAPSFMEQVGSGASQVGQYAQQNPVLTNQALSYAQQAMQQDPAPPIQPGQINRSQMQGGDYMSLLNPQQGSVIRPQQISLLG